jgi:hypothetical protein
MSILVVSSLLKSVIFELISIEICRAEHEHPPFKVLGTPLLISRGVHSSSLSLSSVEHSE